MTRKEQLIEAVDNNTVLLPMIEDIIHLEEELAYLRSLPQLIVHPKDKSRQKATPAAKMYKEKLQQYSNLMKILIRATGMDEVEEDSPLRKYLKSRE